MMRRSSQQTARRESPGYLYRRKVNGSLGLTLTPASNCSRADTEETTRIWHQGLQKVAYVSFRIEIINGIGVNELFRLRVIRAESVSPSDRRPFEVHVSVRRQRNALTCISARYVCRVIA
jgi:hypothetical protein